MSRFYQLLIVLLFTSALTGAAAGSARTEGSVYPSGLHGPSDVVTGIYPGTDAGNCCWVGARAIFRISVPRSADTFLLNIYLPDFGTPKNGQSIRVQIGSAPVQLRCCLGTGEHELLFTLPAQARHGDVLIQLWPSNTFVPKEIGLNQDPRHLSILLRSIAFFNAVTGERFDSPPLPGLPPQGTLAILVVAGLSIFALTLRRPMFGAAALILTDPFLFAYAIHGTTVTLPKVALLAVAAGIAPRALKLVRVRPGSAASLLAGAQLFFTLSMIPGSLHATFHGPAAREVLKALQYLSTLVLAYLAYRLDSDERAVRLSFSIVTLAVTALAFAQLFGGAPQSEVVAGQTVTRIAGPLEGPNQLAGFLGVVIPAMLAFAVWRPPLMIERFALAFGIIGCIMTFSRGGIGALVLGITVLIAVRYAPLYRAQFGGALLALFLLILGLAFGVFTGTLHERGQSLFGSTGHDAFNGGLGSRIDLWHGAYALWRSHPLFGIGAGNYEIAIGRFDPGVRTHANGMYFQVLAEQGILGLTALAAVVVASVAPFVRNLTKPLALAACAAAIAMAFHQIVDCMWIYPKVGVIWWILLALGAAAVDAARDTVMDPALP